VVQGKAETQITLTAWHERAGRVSTSVRLG
jgi:hypothetical protein